MAYRRKTKRTQRRRKVGGVLPKKYQNDTTLVLGVVGGMAGARLIPALLNKMVPNMSPKLVNLAQAGLGIVGAVSTKKSPLLRGVAVGVGAMGAMDLATNLGIMPNAEATMSGDEVLVSLGGNPSHYIGSGVGASFADQHYVNNHIAGLGG